MPAIDQTWQPRSVWTIAVRSVGDAATATPPGAATSASAESGTSTGLFIAFVSGLRPSQTGENYGLRRGRHGRARERWTRVVLRYRVPVLVLWLGALVAGGWAAERLQPLLADSFEIPGTDSDRASAILAQHFGERADGAFVVVSTSPERRTPASGRTPGAVSRVAARAVQTAHGRAPIRRRMLWAPSRPPRPAARQAPHGRSAAPRGRRGADLRHGQPAIQRDLDRVFASDLRRGQAIALSVALLVLVAVFGLSRRGDPVRLRRLHDRRRSRRRLALAHQFSMVGYVTNLVELDGLALAIDYSP